MEFCVGSKQVNRRFCKMVMGSRMLFREIADLSKILSEFLVCPLSKQPLRYCKDTQSLISDSVGVSFPIVNGSPCLVPKAGKLLRDQENSNGQTGVNSPDV